MNATKQEQSLQEQEAMRRKKEFEEHERELQEKLALVRHRAIFYEYEVSSFSSYFFKNRPKH